MTKYLNETEHQAANRQNNTEIEDTIRLKILMEQFANLHSKICHEEFRTKEERNAFLDVIDTLNIADRIITKNYDNRKTEYYDNKISCNYNGKV